MSERNLVHEALLAATSGRAKRLVEILERQAADLAASSSVSPDVRESGLVAIARVSDCAKRLMIDCKVTLDARVAEPLPCSPDSAAEAEKNDA